MPFNLFPILWRLLLLRMNKLLNFQYFFRNFTCNSPAEPAYGAVFVPFNRDGLLPSRMPRGNSARRPYAGSLPSFMAASASRIVSSGCAPFCILTVMYGLLPALTSTRPRSLTARLPARAISMTSG